LSGEEGEGRREEMGGTGGKTTHSDVGKVRVAE